MNKQTIKYQGQCEILSFYDLSEKHQDDIKENYDSIEESSFFIDKHGNLHDLNNFMRVTKTMDKLQSFHGYNVDSFFSMELIILDDCGDSVKLFNAYC